MITRINIEISDRRKRNLINMKHFQVENAPYPNMDGMVSTKIHQFFFSLLYKSNEFSINSNGWLRSYCVPLISSRPWDNNNHANESSTMFESTSEYDWMENSWRRPFDNCSQPFVNTQKHRSTHTHAHNHPGKWSQF